MFAGDMRNNTNCLGTVSPQLIKLCSQLVDKEILIIQPEIIVPLFFTIHRLNSIQ